MNTYNFALIGAAGYIAPRHMQAIKETGHNLIAAVDVSDSVGILDRYFPEVAFFIEFERFDRHLEKLKRQGQKMDYIVVCSPNYLHDAHIRFGLRYGAHVICEKPIVLNPWNLDLLAEIEKESGYQILNILQLRLHPSIIALRERICSAKVNKIYTVDLTYITTRGQWYFTSWKGNEHKSGGIATNIGVHFFDVLQWIFGPVIENIVHINTHDRAAGALYLEKATVRWFLSINKKTLPTHIQQKNATTFRSLSLDGEEIEFSEGFGELHTQSYKAIIEGSGFRLNDVKPSIDIVHAIRNQVPIGVQGLYHPLCSLPLEKHPFT